jgi:hypothetical protein
LCSKRSGRMGRNILLRNRRGRRRSMMSFRGTGENKDKSKKAKDKSKR